MATAVKNITRTKKYRALIAIGMTPDQAAEAYAKVTNPKPAEPTPTEKLIAAGFSPEEAEAVLAQGEVVETAPEPVVEEVDPVAALITKHGFDFAKGRVYLSGDAIEAAVRVRRTGQPEIIASTATGARRARAVVLYKGDGGDVICQNLIREA